jgi:hypothetical protein
MSQCFVNIENILNCCYGYIGRRQKGKTMKTQINLTLTPEQVEQLDALRKAQPFEAKRQAVARELFRVALDEAATKLARGKRRAA